MKKKESECSVQIWREREEKRGSERERERGGRQTPLSESRSAVFKLTLSL